MKTQEIWKDIPDYEGIYQASNLGRIRSLEKNTRNGISTFKHHEMMILKPYLKQSNKNPRRKNVIITLSKNNIRKTYYVARLVASAFYGKSDLTINHINGNPLDNRIENLEWCSLEENIRKGFEQGLYDKKLTNVRVVDKSTGKIFVFESCASAGRYFGKSQSYWFRPKKDTRKFRWELL